MACVLVVINPNSGVTHIGNFVAQSASTLLSMGLRGHFFVPQSPTEFGEISQRARSVGAAACVVVGGDGTAQLCLEPLVSSQIPAYFFPHGTANDFAHALGHQAVWQTLAAALISPSHRYVDVIQVNDVKFVTVGGFGVGSILTEEMNRRRASSPFFQRASRVLKSTTYSLLAARSIIFDANLDMDFEIDLNHRTQVFRSACVFVANQNFLGGSIRVNPDASNEDGKLNLLVLRDLGRVELLRSLLLMRSGRLPDSCWQAEARETTIRVRTKNAAGFFADGENLLTGNTFHFRVLPQALKVLVQEGGVS